MKRISRNLTAAALASSLSLAGVAAASAEENTEPNATDLVDAIVKADETGTTEGGKTEGGKTETGKTEGENGKTEGEKPGKTEGEKPGNNETKPGNNETKPGKGETKPGKGEGNEDKDKSSIKDIKAEDIKAKLSSEDGKPTKLGIAGIVAGVLAAIAAVVPAAAQALNIKLPF